MYGGLQLHTVYKNPYFLLQVTREAMLVLQKSRENLYQVRSIPQCFSNSNHICHRNIYTICTYAPLPYNNTLHTLTQPIRLLVLHTNIMIHFYSSYKCLVTEPLKSLSGFHSASQSKTVQWSHVSA